MAEPMRLYISGCLQCFLAAFWLASCSTSLVSIDVAKLYPLPLDVGSCHARFLCDLSSLFRAVEDVTS